MSTSLFPPNFSDSHSIHGLHNYRKSAFRNPFYRIRETLPQEVSGKMYAPGPAKDIPFVTPKILKDYDAFLFGIPTRYGSYSAQ